MKRVILFAFVCIVVVSTNSCAFVTGKVEEKIVEDVYPGIEKDVVKRVELFLSKAVESGRMTPELAKELRPFIYQELISARDELRHKIFGIEER